MEAGEAGSRAHTGTLFHEVEPASICMLQCHAGPLASAQSLCCFKFLDLFLDTAWSQCLLIGAGILPGVLPGHLLLSRVLPGHLLLPRVLPGHLLLPGFPLLPEPGQGLGWGRHWRSFQKIRCSLFSLPTYVVHLSGASDGSELDSYNRR